MKKFFILALCLISLGCQKSKEAPLDRQEEVDPTEKTQEYHQKDL